MPIDGSWAQACFDLGYRSRTKIRSGGVKRVLQIPLDRLPAIEADRHAALRDYFCDKDAEATQVGAFWSLSLHWPSDLQRHVDPRLLDGLAWWNDGVKPETMALARRRSGRILTALYDTWTLHSWSEWLERRGRIGEAVILHVDDHRDVAAPRLIVDGDGFRDAITSEPVNLANSEQVRSAIESGAIGMGSFMTPFLHVAPQTEVRHLCQAPKAHRTTNYHIELSEEPDRLLQPGAGRPAVILRESVGASGPGTYRSTPSLEDWIDGAAKPALLHIDMDYFCNRYDGDSMWSTRTAILDPPISDVETKIDALIGTLRLYVRKAPIEDIVIAYSPGFFPAEFWGEADARLRAGLETLDGA